MSIASSFLIALSLSMDNFAAALASGCGGHHALSRGRILAVSGMFTAAHFIMFALGWLGGHEVVRHIDWVDHWIAFGMLVWIGGRMIKEALSAAPEHTSSALLSLRAVCSIAVATSLDALLVGVGLSVIHAPFWVTACFMVLCVFVTSCCGFWLGGFLGYRFGRIMEISGGLVLAGIGVKILLSGLGIW